MMIMTFWWSKVTRPIGPSGMKKKSDPAFLWQRRRTEELGILVSGYINLIISNTQIYKIYQFNHLKYIKYIRYNFFLTIFRQVKKKYVEQGEENRLVDLLLWIVWWVKSSSLQTKLVLTLHAGGEGGKGEVNPTGAVVLIPPQNSNIPTYHTLMPELRMTRTPSANHLEKRTSSIPVLDC